MIDKILLNILSTTLFLTSSIATPVTDAPKYAFTKVLPEKNYVSHVVEKDETISKIAFRFYGNEDYWTNLWKDNDAIKDPNVLEEGTMLRINLQKPELPEDASSLIAQAIPSVEPQIQSVSATMPVNTAQVTPAVAQQATQTASVPKSLSDEAINYLGNCEAGMDPAKNTGNGYYGAFQFSAGTWNSMGTGYARADQAPLEVQKEAVQRLVARSSIYTQFPACARRMQSAGLI
jgi:LysM repeat protein